MIPECPYCRDIVLCSVRPIAAGKPMHYQCQMSALAPEDRHPLLPEHANPADRRITHGPMLTRDQVTELRGFLADRWRTP